jgi:protein O-GlcNAc transferase
VTSIQETLHLAVENHRAGRLAEAKALYRAVLERHPRHPDALHLLGVIAHHEGRNDEALELINEAIRLEDRNADFFINLGLVFEASNRLQDAIEAYQRALAIRPDDPLILYNLGTAFSRLGRGDRAIDSFNRALLLRRDLPEAWFNLGNAYAAAGELESAVTAYREALALRPGLAEAQQNLGNALTRLGRLEEALACYERAIQIRPDFAAARQCLAGAYFNRANALRRTGRRDEAVEWYEKALALGPSDLLHKVYCNLGNTLSELERPDEALTCFEQVLALQPESAEVYGNLATALRNLGRVDEALIEYERKILLLPDFAPAYSSMLFTMLCKSGNDPQETFAAHRRFGFHFESDLRQGWRPHVNVRDPDRKLKVGYVSSDFRLHSVARFLEPVLAHHDRHRVELYGYYNHETQDQVTVRIRERMNHWLPCKDLSDDELAERIRGEGIDILVDLAGHTGDNRLLVFARKPAPVQVTYLGYPTTTGLSAMDWRLTTWEVDPEGSERWYTERLYRLPRTLWCYRSPQEGECGEMAPTPALSKGHVTFGSMNHLAKISQETVEVWGAILRELPDARLVMTSIPEGMAQERLKERFAAQGIPPERLRLHGRLPAERFRALSRGIDIVLDPFPYNGTTTTCEALWMGLPVITLIGKTSVARSGYALLKTVGLEGLCAKDGAEYVRIAAGLARNPSRLDALRQGMRSRLEASPLRDEEGFARDIEEAYREMWREWCHADP